MASSTAATTASSSISSAATVTASSKAAASSKAVARAIMTMTSTFSSVSFGFRVSQTEPDAQVLTDVIALRA
ncbi:hypothetical protein [Roseofilum capinflatum]|uniref:Uncharacterized protein n=1 Tax=Roseofilum capinflatum BLCC-M114 TaxID=3022440 RepID=A0ABT7B9N9_9CYAN|nr:hypothetical protein [Roseofilum capinflatum]MDJ1175888.1 hypothetical protein [Roseofilum capinflatum BLCC-M114]